jgi:hypothetical protein
MVAMLACICAAACSLSESVFPDPEPGEGDYRTVAVEVRQVFDRLKLPGRPEISDVHRNRSPFPADWALCLRNDDPARRQYYTLFFRNKKVTDYRLSVIADACETDSFAPLVQ